MKKRLLTLFALGLGLTSSTWALDQVGGVYQIGTAGELADFAALVNGGEVSANAVLTADIDYTTAYVQIGGDYRGTFDGQGHTVTVAIGSTAQGAALFKNQRGTVQNLRVAGTITTSSNNPGGICYYNYGTIRNCVAEVDFILTGAGVSVTAGGISGQATSGSRIENCMFKGSFTKGEGANENTKNVAGIVGWMDGSPTVSGCLVIASSDLGGDFKPVGRGYNRATNTYYMQKAGSATSIQTSTGATAVTAEQLSSGEIAYLTGATQDIGSETLPNFLGTSSKVYAIGTEGNRCDLAPLGDIDHYSNDKPAVSAHNFVDGICTICDSYDESQIIDGIYQIGTAKQLKWFAAKVNEGDNHIDAQLTADIDYTTAYVQIGGNFYGTFDGQGHTVTVAIESTAQGAALFKNQRGTVQNLRVAGTITTSSNNPGGICYYNYSTIRNCVAEVDFILTGAGVSVTAGGISGQATSGSRIENCMFKGSFTKGEGANEDTKNVAGIVGWMDGSPTVSGCLVIASSDLGGDFKPVGRGYNTATNTYHMQDGGSTDIQESNGSTLVTSDQLASGEVAYLTGATQNIGSETLPNFLGTSGKVYAIGTEGNRCDLAPLGDIDHYSNDKPAVSAHNFVDGICTMCGTLEEGYVQLVNGYYQIETEGQLVWFANQVDKGNPSINGKLMNDIELAKAWTSPIGTEDTPYSGTFNGQGYSISGFDLTYEGGKQGLFGCINGATVQDFSIKGTIAAFGNGGSNAAVGIIAWSTYSAIQNVHSDIIIDATGSTAYSLGSTHVGGVVGSLRTGSTIGRCTFSGALLNGGNKVDCFGCVIGYINDNAQVSNCANYGTLTSDATEGCAGGIIGYMNTYQAKVTKCLNVGTIAYYVSGNGGAIIGLQNDWGYSSAPNAVTDCYWLEGSAQYATGKNDNGKNPSVTDEQLSGGELAWLLNGRSFIEPVWHQTVGEDYYPLPYSGDIVYQTAEGYASFTPADPTSVSKFINATCEREQAFIGETIACQDLLDAYQEDVEAWQSGSYTYQQFCGVYAAAQEKRNAINASAEAYAAYIKACQDAATYIEENSLEGSMADLLKAYLEEDEAPSADYPNGTHYYIIEKHELTDEEIAEETAFVTKMLENAIAGGITAGTEITRLLTNSNFTQGFDGWTAEYEGGSIATGGVKELMPIARGLNNSSLSISQTLTDLPAGIYMLAANGMFRSAGDVTTQFYAGQLYLNSTANYIMSPGEDIVSEDEAEDRVNCYINEDTHYEDYNNDMYGYVPNTMVGASYAFSAGRYLNLCATEVTDGNLTIGMRNLGTGLKNDFMPFGGLHVYYLGTADKADDRLTDVLQGFADRAQTIVDFSWSEYEDYAQRPNMSEDIKERLSALIAQAGNAATGAKKLSLIQKFSDLFAEVYACRKAYIEMNTAASELFGLIDVLLNADAITWDEYTELEEKIYEATGHYTAGDITAGEALEIAAELREAVLPIKDGAYQLASAKDLKTFSLLTNTTGSASKAVLAADIDMSGTLDFVPIGTSEKPFTGEFDGQGHCITGFNMEGASGNGQGLFGFTNGATIQNFSISGSIDYYGGTGVGVVGWSQAGTTIRNVHSQLNINVIEVSSHIGGVVGAMRSGTKLSGCSFSGAITDTAGSDDCIGGLAGYANEYSSFENCANYGTVTFSRVDCFAGGILGYLNNSSFAGMKNCLSVGTVQTADGGASTYGGALAGRIRSYDPTAFQNNYWLEGSAERVSGENAIQGEAVSADRLWSGEICYKLNPSDINWYQTLFTDETHTPDPYPVLFPSHEEVHYSETLGYYNANDPDGIGEVKNEELRMKNDAVYDLSGRQLPTLNSQLSTLNSKIYIVGGKKILVK